MAEGDLEFNDDQILLLILAGISFLFFFILIDSIGFLCCCTTIILLIGVPFAATKTNANINYNTVNQSSPNLAMTTSERKRKNKKVMTHKKDTFPKEWLDLKEIYPEAEIDEYADYDNFSSGHWDMAGLRDDLEIMIERTGKTPSKNKSKGKQTTLENEDITDFKKHSFESMMALPNRKLRKLLKERGLSTNGVKAKLIERLMESIIEEKEAKEKSSDSSNKKPKVTKKAKVKKKVTKKVMKKKAEEKTTPIECPDCSAIIYIPDVPGTYEIECTECGIEGEIEL